MLFSIITLFPEIFSSVFSASILKRAQTDGKIEIRIINLRDFGIGRHKIVDDKPYGGGTGMVLRVDVLDRAISSTKGVNRNEKVVLLDPKGQKLNQSLVESFSEVEHLILVCARYEGVDERVRKLVDMEISIGDYILSGGEIPAMVLVESVSRLVSGVLKKEEATKLESFSKINPDQRILEHPHYTRPGVYKKMKAPKILLSGNQKKVEKYRINQALKVTKERRPDILKS